MILSSLSCEKQKGWRRSAALWHQPNAGCAVNMLHSHMMQGWQRPELHTVHRLNLTCSCGRSWASKRKDLNRLFDRTTTALRIQSPYLSERKEAVALQTLLCDSRSPTLRNKPQRHPCSCLAVSAAVELTERHINELFYTPCHLVHLSFLHSQWAEEVNKASLRYRAMTTYLRCPQLAFKTTPR